MNRNRATATARCTSVSEAVQMLNHRRRGTGSTLVLLHGFVGGSGYWIPQEVALERYFDVISVDLPGFAGSATVAASDSLAGYGRAVIALLDELGVDNFSIMGFSMGGMIAQELTRANAGRVRSLVLYGSSAVGDLPHRFESWNDAIARLDRDGVEAIIDRTVATWFVDGKHHPYYVMCREACRGADKNACMKAMRAMQGWRSVEWLDEINTPTLIIVGDKDRSTKPSDSIVLWQGIRNSQFCILPNCAHGAHLEKPELFNRVLADFLLGSLSG